MDKKITSGFHYFVEVVKISDENNFWFKIEVKDEEGGNGRFYFQLDRSVGEIIKNVVSV